MAAPLMPSPKGFESGRLDDPSSMLTYHARQGLGHGSSLISALSEEDKAQLAEELTISGWRSHSPMLQSALAKALGHRQSMLSASQMTTEDVDGMLDSNSALLWNSVEHEHDVHADSSELSQQIGTQQRGGDWSLTQQDIAVMEQSWREPRTRQSAGEAEREEEAVKALPYFEEEWDIPEKNIWAGVQKLQRVQSTASAIILNPSSPAPRRNRKAE